MSSLPSSLWPPPPPADGDTVHPLAAVLPPPPSSNSVSPSLLIIGAILLFVILASVLIHFLLRVLSGRRSATSPSSARVFSTSSLSSESFGHLHFPAQTETNQESNDNKEKADALIEALPLFTLASSLAALPKSSPDCAVCLSPFDPTAELRLLPACRHAFHSECIDTWLRSTPSCPLCRASVRLPFPPLPSSAGGAGNGRMESFRVEIGSISRRRTDENPNSASGRSYSIGSFDYRIEDEIDAVISRIGRLKEEKEGDPTAVRAPAPPPPGENVAELAGGGENRGWLRDYVDRLASTASSSFNSLRFSNRWSNSRRQENAAGVESRRWDVEAAALAEQGEEEEAFYAVYRWIIGV
ncbi:hypothetical protein LUZ60_016915 [Juncus effusus]|nr:hypothetical protein LUZ60_016915 [Juncus effusus]